MCQDVRPTPRRAAFGVASSRIPDGTARQGAGEVGRKHAGQRAHNRGFPFVIMVEVVHVI